jgi:AraC-like DNA-binding protein
MFFDTAAEPLAAFPCIKTSNPEEWRHAIKSLLFCSKHDIMPGENFSAYVNATTLGSITLIGMGNLSKFSHLYAHESKDTLVNFLLSGNIAIKTGRDEYSYTKNGMNIVHRYDRPMHISAENVISVHFLFNQSIIQNFINTVYGSDFTQFKIKDTIDSQANNSYFKHVICETVKSIDAHPDIVKQPLIASQYEQLLMLALLTTPPYIRHSITHKAQPTSSKSVKIVEEYIEENLDQPVRLEDLAGVSGQSVRTIQEAFKKYRGYSPSSFLRECRLAKARKILQESPKDTSIVSVALVCGFASHGHFCSSYKKRFGENPLHTLKRAHQ